MLSPEQLVAAPESTKDPGKVRLGGYSPNLRFLSGDNTVAAGGAYTPFALVPTGTVDNGAVRIGGYAPTF